MRQPITIAASIVLFVGCGGASPPAPEPTPTPTPLPTPAQPGDSCLPPPSGLVAWWPADGGAMDVVGQRNGSLVGASGFAAGVVREAFHFPNVSKSAPDYVGTDWVRVPDDEAWELGSRPFTIEMWISFENVLSEAPHQQPLIGHSEGPGSTNKWILWLQSGSLTFHVNGPQMGGTNPVSCPWSPAPFEWHHVAVTRQGSDWSLFIDGQQEAIGTNALAIPDVAADLTIGRAEDTWLEGRADEVSIYDRALSADEIAALSTASGGKCAP
jgi:hypothetical protein